MTKQIDSRIFDTTLVDTYQPLFLGKNGGLFDSLHNPYPEIMDMYMKLKVMDWSHTDFPFRICNQQFKSSTAGDYDKMIKTIAFQWEADSTAAQHLYPITAPYISNHQLQLAWQRVGENEGLHALTYSEIVRSSFDNPSKVKKEILDIQASLDRMSEIAAVFSQAYDVSHKLSMGIIDRDDPIAYRAIFMFVVALYCLERIQFMSSFAVTYAYADTGLYMPIGHAVQKIQTDELEIHQALDRTILKIEMNTPRGRDFFENNKKEIESLVHSVLQSELQSNKVLFSEGGTAAGLTYEQLNAFSKSNVSPVLNTFGFDDPYRDIGTPLPSRLYDWFNMNKWQSSPQEQRSGNYLRAFVTRDAKPSYSDDMSLLLGTAVR